MKPEKVYACYSKDKDVRLSSSSGAVFSSLAEYVLNKNGIIYGVAMSEDCYSAEFIAVTDRSELIKLRGSKYLQAKVGDTFKKVKAELQAGKLVLFTGTGASTALCAGHRQEKTTCCLSAISRRSSVRIICVAYRAKNSIA